MALSEQSRNTIYEFLVPNIGEEAAREMLSNFPTDGSAPASEDFVHRELAAVRAAIAGHDGRLDSLETRMTALEGGMTALEGRMTSLEGGMTSLEGRTTALEHRMIDGFADLRIEIHDGFRRMAMFMTTTFVAMLAVLVAANAVFS